MTSRIALSVDARGVMLAQLAGLLDGGTIRIYSTATAAPATPNDPVPDGSIVLAALTIATPSESEIDAGTITFNPTTTEAVLVTGDAGWVRAEDADGNGVLDYNVGTGDEAITLPRVALVTGEPITLAAWSFTLPPFVES